MQWNLTFIRITGKSNTISILKTLSLGQVVQKWKNAEVEQGA